MTWSRLWLTAQLGQFTNIKTCPPQTYVLCLFTDVISLQLSQFCLLFAFHYNFHSFGHCLHFTTTFTLLFTEVLHSFPCVKPISNCSKHRNLIQRFTYFKTIKDFACRFRPQQQHGTKPFFNMGAQLEMFLLLLQKVLNKQLV